jgi:hypothetical protein
MKKNNCFVTKKLRLLAGMFVMVLIFGVVLLGCSDGTSDETDTSGNTDKPDETDIWSAVTSLDQLDGTWKGSYSEGKTMTIREWAERIGGSWRDEDALLVYGDMKVTSSGEVVTLTINATAKTRASSFTQTVTFSGGNISAPGVWEMLRSKFSGKPYVITIDDTKHSVTLIEIEPEEKMSDEDIAEMLDGLHINQTGTKVKVPTDKMDPGSPAFTFIKQ